MLELAQALHAEGVELYSTGGTKQFLEQAGLPVVGVDAVTQFPEMLDGRVKTLHPRIFGGILARRETPSHVTALREHAIPFIDLVVVNLYPFHEHRTSPLLEQVEWVDIGGPSLLRAAAKNFEWVTVLCDPGDYGAFLADARASGEGLSPTLAWRQRAAAKVFAHTSEYDLQIAANWSEALRYGENPHQRATWFTGEPVPWRALQGKELSYNNLLDADAAWRALSAFTEPTAIVVKHTSPCGAASDAHSVAAALERALAADSVSAFGGIVAVNGVFDARCAQAAQSVFLEVIVAHAFDAEARERLATKKNLRLVEWPAAKGWPGVWEVRSAFGGLLVQSPDLGGPEVSEWKWMTDARPSAPQTADLVFAWKMVAAVKSNAIVIAKDRATLGVGGGQTNRVGALEQALRAAPKDALRHAVLASDAFFPFRDSIDLLRQVAGNTGAGVPPIGAVIEPGGSVRDPEVIEACREFGIPLAFTGMRHFRH